MYRLLVMYHLPDMYCLLHMHRSLEVYRFLDIDRLLAMYRCFICTVCLLCTVYLICVCSFYLIFKGLEENFEVIFRPCGCLGRPWPPGVFFGGVFRAKGVGQFEHMFSYVCIFSRFTFLLNLFLGGYREHFLGDVPSMWGSVSSKFDNFSATPGICYFLSPSQANA